MALIDIVKEFGDNMQNADRAVFKEAVLKKIEKDGMTMEDILYEIYLCEKRIAKICDFLDLA